MEEAHWWKLSGAVGLWLSVIIPENILGLGKRVVGCMRKIVCEKNSNKNTHTSFNHREHVGIWFPRVLTSLHPVAVSLSSFCTNTLDTLRGSSYSITLVILGVCRLMLAANLDHPYHHYLLPWTISDSSQPPPTTVNHASLNAHAPVAFQGARGLLVAKYSSRVRHVNTFQGAFGAQGAMCARDMALLSLPNS